MEEITPLAPQADSNVAKSLIKQQKEEWIKKPNSFPALVGGDLGDNGRDQLEFKNATMFPHTPDIASSILNTDGVFRPYKKFFQFIYGPIKWVWFF